MNKYTDLAQLVQDPAVEWSIFVCRLRLMPTRR